MLDGYAYPSLESLNAMPIEMGTGWIPNDEE